MIKISVIVGCNYNTTVNCKTKGITNTINTILNFYNNIIIINKNSGQFISYDDTPLLVYRRQWPSALPSLNSPSHDSTVTSLL